MQKRQPVTLSIPLPDDTYAEAVDRAEAAGVTLHEWIVAAIEREAFRQLCAEQERWNTQHPGDPVADHERRSAMRDDRGSSAA